MAGFINAGGGGAAEVVGVKDSNGPIEATNTTSITHNLGDTWDEILILPARDNAGFDQLRVNGITTADYRFERNDGSTVSGTTEWELPDFTKTIRAIHLFVDKSAGTAGFYADSHLRSTQSGQLTGQSITSIDSVTFLTGSAQSMTAQVIGRNYEL